jgi:hypothetical protein
MQLNFGKVISAKQRDAVHTNLAKANAQICVMCSLKLYG